MSLRLDLGCGVTTYCRSSKDPLTSPPSALRKNLMVVSRWLVLDDSAGYGSSPNFEPASHLQNTCKI